MKAIRLLKEYQNIDFGCDMSAHIKDCDEAIEELEALENKSCSTCRYESVSGFDFPCDSCKWVNQADRWEAKDD